MKLLLDTCTFLWMIGDEGALSAAAREAVVDPANDVHLSAVSAWEIAMKHALGRLPLPDAPSRFVPRWREAHGVVSLPLTEAAALALPRLPLLHRDPFDRMLVCLAIEEGLTIVTPDPLIAAYPVRTLW